MNDIQREIETATVAVRQAMLACQAVQAQLVPRDTLAKQDRSPVTVADFASQAVVCAALQEAFPDDPVVGEESAGALREDQQSVLRDAVVKHVSESMGRDVEASQVLAWIDRGGADESVNRKRQRHWTLDPIDGTKGFLRREQYAVALALIEDGQVVLGVLGCPNLEGGMILVAPRGQGVTTLDPQNENNTSSHPRKPSRSAAGTSPELPTPSSNPPRFCESVESAHSDQSATARIATKLNITTPPLRMDSQVKYAAVALGLAGIYLRMPTSATYREKIWDHAAGLAVVLESGGMVTDATGRPLDFTQGRTLAGNRGIIATGHGVAHGRVVQAVAAEL